jgi:hypothetical protein
VNPVVDLFFELGFVDEAVNLQAAEEMVSPIWSRGGWPQYKAGW